MVRFNFSYTSYALSLTIIYIYIGEAAIRYHLLEEACDLLLLPDSETDSISDSDSRENFPSPSGFSLPDNFTLGVRARRLGKYLFKYWYEYSESDN